MNMSAQLESSFQATYAYAEKLNLKIVLNYAELRCLQDNLPLL